MRNTILFLIMIIVFILPIKVWSELRQGDFVLLPMNCFACRVISDESSSPYSHMGIILEISKKGIILAESLGSVRRNSLSSFKQRLIPGEKLGFFRLKEWDKLYNQNIQSYIGLMTRLIARYKQDYEGAKYDDQFLWDNFDDFGREKFYCSEFITKLVNPFIKNQIGVHAMNYLLNWDFWVKYMRGNPPQGLPGNNPSFFTDNKLFIQVSSGD